jgi:hypothetical protein
MLPHPNKSNPQQAWGQQKHHYMVSIEEKKKKKESYNDFMEHNKV